MFDLVSRIDQIIEKRSLDAFMIKGQISMKAGTFLVIIRPETPYDKEQYEAIRGAAEEVLGQPIS